jgi:hypothetical protein
MGTKPRDERNDPRSITSLAAHTLGALGGLKGFEDRFHLYLVIDPGHILNCKAEPGQGRRRCRGGIGGGCGAGAGTAAVSASARRRHRAERRGAGVRNSAAAVTAL